MISIDLVIILIAFIINYNKKVLNSFSKGPLLGLVVSLIVFTTYAIFSAFKFQMVLVYLLFIFNVVLYSGLIFLNFSKRKFKIQLNNNRKISLICIIITLIFVLFFPMDKFNYPMGEHKIVSKTIDLENSERNSIFNKEGKRVISLRFFYPSDNYQEQRAVWLNNGSYVIDEINNKYEVPKFFLNYLETKEINAYIDGSISNFDEKMPVVIISHKLKYLDDYYVGLAEKLASNGYFVATINHTYFSLFNTTKYDQCYYAEEEIPVRNNDIEFRDKMKFIQKIYSDDINDGIKAIEKMNREAYNFALNTNEIYLIGHEMGGSASISLGLKDNRVKKVVAIDPSVEFVEDIDQMREAPLHIQIFKTDYFHEANQVVLRELLDSPTLKTRVYEKNHSTSRDYTILYYLSPISNWLGITEASDLENFHQLVMDFISKS